MIPSYRFAIKGLQNAERNGMPLAIAVWLPWSMPAGWMADWSGEFSRSLHRTSAAELFNSGGCANER
jgi:hypothetical protein